MSQTSNKRRKAGKQQKQAVGLSQAALPAGRPAALPLDAETWPLLARFWHTWVKRRWKKLLLCFFLMAVVAATTGLYPLIIKYSFDTLGAGDASVLWLVVGTIAGVTAARGLFLYLQAIETSKVVMRTTLSVQRDVFAHLIASDFARVSRDTPGHHISRLTNDITFIQNAAMAVLNTALRDILTVIALVISMFYLDWMLSLFILCIYPLAAFPIARIGQRLRRVAKRTQAELGGMTSGLSESLSGARLIKTYGLEDYATERTNGSFEEVFRLRMKAVRAKASIDPMLEALGGLAVAGVIAFAGYRIASGINSVGDFTGFVSALLMAAQPIRALGSLNAKLQEGLAAVQRVYEILDEKPEIVDREGALPLAVASGTITFEDVAFAYDGSEPTAVQDLSLSVPGGQTVALVGRSGGGKSTIINLVPRLFEPTRGRILIDGQDIRMVTLASLRQSIALVSQDITLFNDTVRANIALGRLEADDAAIKAAAQAAAADEFIAQLPEGYATVIGDRGMRLSGGQRQRIALARAILRDAPILLLDEATSALDAESEQLVQEALGSFSRGRTTLVIAHRLSTVQRADKICVVEDGTIVEAGPHEQLLAAGGVYARLCRSQLMTGGNGASRARDDDGDQSEDGEDEIGEGETRTRASGRQSGPAPKDIDTI